MHGHTNTTRTGLATAQMLHCIAIAATLLEKEGACGEAVSLAHEVGGYEAGHTLVIEVRDITICHCYCHFHDNLSRMTTFQCKHDISFIPTTQVLSKDEAESKADSFSQRQFEKHQRNETRLDLQAIERCAKARQQKLRVTLSNLGPLAPMPDIYPLLPYFRRVWCFGCGLHICNDTPLEAGGAAGAKKGTEDVTKDSEGAVELLMSSLVQSFGLHQYAHARLAYAREREGEGSDTEAKLDVMPIMAGVRRHYAEHLDEEGFINLPALFPEATATKTHAPRRRHKRTRPQQTEKTEGTPLCLEVGSGDGEWALHHAKANPNQRWVSMISLMSRDGHDVA